MTSIRNLPLAVRLGGAFGALCVALAVIAFTGLHAMSGLQEKADVIAERHLRAAQLLGDLRMRTKDNVSLIGQHLYVRDGDLASEDKILHDVEANWAKNKADSAELDKLFAGSPAAAQYAEFAAKRAEMVKLQKAALTQSRAETVRNAEDRSGSRGLFESQLLKADDVLEASGEKLAQATTQFAATGVAEAHAADTRGKHIIWILTLAAILAAVAVAVWVTRSVVRPVKELSDRLTKLDQHCLTGRANGLDAVASGDLS